MLYIENFMDIEKKLERASMIEPQKTNSDTAEQEGYLSRIAKLESQGIETFLPGKNTYDAIKNGASINPDKTAIQYLLRGDYFDKKKIPLKAKIAHKLLGDIASPNRSITFKELVGGVNQCANYLHDIGVRENDVVSLLLPNFIETHYALWGSEAAGIVNPINPLLEAEVIRDILNAAGTKVLIALGKAPGNDIWQKVLQIKDQVPTLEKVLVLYGKSIPSQGIFNFEKTLKKYPADRLQYHREILSSDAASMFHTGGTTGTPKIAVHSHGNEVANITQLRLTLDSSDEEKVLVALPLFHVNAAIATGLMPFSHGMPIVLAGPAGFRSEQVMENFFNIIEHYRVSIFSAVPTALGALLNVDSKGCDLSSLKLGMSGAAPIPVETFKQFQDKTGIRLLEGYGLTEATCVSSLTPLEGEARVGSVGIRLPFSKIKIAILDEAGSFIREANQNEIGVLVLTGPNVFSGYLEEKHNESLWVSINDESWLNTGDLGRMDQDSYVWLTGRKKELIIRGGHNIDPKSIEGPIASMPGVELVAAVPRPDPYSGEVPVAYVTLANSTLTEEDIMDFAKQTIQEKAAIPKAIHIIDEMPVTAVGKIFKPQLTWWEIENIIKGHINDIFSQAEAMNFDINVDKDEQFGCLAAIKLLKDVSNEKIDALTLAVNQYSFHYQIIK